MTASRTEPPEDDHALLEQRVARTADLLLKVSTLLDREAGRLAGPARDDRVARLSWAVERARHVLLDDAGGPGRRSPVG